MANRNQSDQSPKAPYGPAPRARRRVLRSGTTGVSPVGSSARPARRRVLRRLAVSLLATGLLGAVFWAWVVPVLIRSEIRRQVDKVWRGEVRIGSLDLDWSGTLVLRDAQLLDGRGRQWLRLDQASVELGDWPSLRPTIRRVRARKVDVAVHLDGGSPILPVQPGGDHVDLLANLESVEATQIAMTLSDDSGKFEQWDDFSVNLRRTGGKYEVALHRPASLPGEISILAQIDPATLEAAMRIFASLDVHPRQGQMLLAAVNAPEVDSARGHVHADLSVNGRLDQPLSLKAEGVLNLGDWRMSSRGSAVVDDLDLDIRVDGLAGEVVQGGLEAGPWAVQVNNIRFSFDRANQSVLLNLALSSRWQTGRMSTFWRQLMADVEGSGQVELAGPLRLSLDTGDLLEADLKGRVQAGTLSVPLRPPLVLSDLEGELSVGPAVVRLQGVSGQVWDGRLEGAVSAMWGTPTTQPLRPPAPSARTQPARARLDDVVFSGDVILTNVDMAEVTRQFQEHDPSRQGRASASGKLSIRGLDVKSLGGKVAIYMDDVEAFRLPVLSQILTFLKIQKETSDFHGTFDMRGLTATIERARLANRLSALEAEPGGTIDLGQGRMDFYLVAVPLSTVRDLLLKIPLVNLLVNLQDKLTRLLVRGQWDAPPSKLLSVQPVRNVGEGTLTFFRDVARSGGQIGGDVLNTLRSIIELPFAKPRKE